ncbi:hypothetical protein F5879DRAFT_1068827 [Lentinula edodes]|nr:hypothetical protein F5879DRAFT_1068827 [Lentinula edodes]
MPVTSFYVNLPPFHQTTHHVVQLPSLTRDVNRSDSIVRLEEDGRPRSQSFERDDPLEKFTADRQPQLSNPNRERIPQPDTSQDVQPTHDPISNSLNDDREIQAFLNTVIRVSDLNPPLSTAHTVDDISSLGLDPYETKIADVRDSSVLNMQMAPTKIPRADVMTDFALIPLEGPTEAPGAGNSDQSPSAHCPPEHNLPVSRARASGQLIEKNDIAIGSSMELGLLNTRLWSDEGVKGVPESISSALRHRRTVFRRDPYPIRSKSSNIRQSHSTTTSDEYDGSIFTLPLMYSGSINEAVNINSTFWVDIFHSRKVKAKTFYTCWYLYSTRSPLDLPPTLSPGPRGPKHNYLFVHVNEAQRENLHSTPAVTDGRPTLLKCMTMWIWNGIAERWEHINYGEERFIADAKSPYCVSLYRETIHPEWITKKAMNKILKKYRGF